MFVMHPPLHQRALQVFGNGPLVVFSPALLVIDACKDVSSEFGRERVTVKG